MAFLFAFNASITSAKPCELLNAAFKSENFTASQPLGTYQHPFQRDLSTYNRAFFGGHDGALSLQKIIPNGGVAIDLGGGVGVAYRELASSLQKSQFIVVSTQPVQSEIVPEALRNTPQNFQHKVGWAEELLRTLPQADAITDFWGAFSYSTEKAFLLEQIYSKLKPGGQAFLLFHPEKTPTFVRDSKGNLIALHTWLAAHYPKIISISPSFDLRSFRAKIIRIQKPADQEGWELPLTISQSWVQKLSGFPMLHYQIKAN